MLRRILQGTHWASVQFCCVKISAQELKFGAQNESAKKEKQECISKWFEVSQRKWEAKCNVESPF